MTKQTKIGLACLVGVIGLAAAYNWFFPGYCRSAKSKYGIELSRCPEGEVFQLAAVHADSLSRTSAGRVRVSVRAVYTEKKADEERSSTLGAFDVSLALVAADETETPITPESESEKDRAKGKKGKWRWTGSERNARIALPAVPDGDYLLRAHISSKVGKTTLDVPLGLYAPAKIHVLTDRPLYEPGNLVQFRSLALRANDLTPIDRRPGKWVVRDPSGQVLLEEKVNASDWGVASGNFPLDSGAQSGEWSVAWQSGTDSGQASFTVQPFTLPRFRVEASADAPFYGAGQAPSLSGAVVYSSGAPVVGARVEVTWRAEGAWPPPSSWLERDLPRVIDVNPNGRFAVTLPTVPADLREQASLVAILSATDPAGDRVSGAARVLLSADPIKVDALTELAAGLVEGSNNRMYLRVTMADGRPLPGARINVKRGWEPTDPGIDTELDEDSVGQVQVDPGPPVNVVVPPMPVRGPVRVAGASVYRGSARDLVSGEEATLADRRAMDSWLVPLAICGVWAGTSSQASVGLRVEPSGRIAVAIPASDEISRCAAKALAVLRLPSGDERMYTVVHHFSDPLLPTLSTDVRSTLSDSPDPIRQLFAAVATEARTCVPQGSPEALGDGLAWTIRAGDKKLSASWIRASSDPPMAPALKACITAALARRELAAAATVADLGIARFSVSHPAHEKPIVAQPTIMRGYELRVTADIGAEATGETVVRLSPGAIPRIRIRASPVVAAPGETILINVLRGPDYDDKLPKKIRVAHLEKVEMIDLDPKERTASYTLPGEADGWYVFDGVEGASARVFVISRSALEVSVAAEKPRYQPGDSAKLTVVTKIGGQGAAAGVGLFGVDSSLGQLVTLPGPDALGGLSPPIGMEAGPAFGILDAQALALGRIRGRSAAEATVLRVSHVPSPADLDAAVNAYASTPFDAIAVLTDRFYPVLGELHAQARNWERTAPPSEVMTNRTLANLWKAALGAVKGRGGNVTDAYGRDLRLHRLPSDLLALTQPQEVVVVGTRLPEDFENWSNWVALEKP